MANIIDITIRSHDQTQGGIDSAGKGGNVLKGVFQGIGQAAGNMLADLPMQALGFFKSAIDGASDLGETVSKNQTIFGAASKELLVWAETAPKSLGMTKQAALDATGTLGNLFTQLGVNADAARKMSQANVQLATDFASFHNAAPEEVIEAMTAAYRGEFDAVQRFVPLLNAANVEEKALLMTKKASKDALTEQDKALAVNALMMEGAGAAAGDFARTSDSAANRSRIAAASFEDMKTKIGDVLLPAWTALLGFITGSFFPALMQLGGIIGNTVRPAFEMAKEAALIFFSAFTGEGVEVTGILGEWGTKFASFGNTARQVFDGVKDAWSLLTTGMTEDELDTNLGEWGPTVKQITDAIREGAAKIPPALDAIGAAFAKVGEVAAPFWERIKGNENLLITIAVIIGGVLLAAVYSLAAGMASLAVSVIAATWPFLAVVAVIFAVIAALRYAYENWEGFRNVVNAVASWLATNVPPLIETMRAGIAVAFEWIVNVAIPFIQNAFSSFMGFLEGTLMPAVTTVWNNILSVIQAVVAFITPIISFLVDFISENFGHIAAIASAVWDMIKNTIANTWQIISNIIQLFLNIISGNWSAAWQNVKNILSAAWDMIQNRVSNGLSIVRELLQGILHFIGSIAGRIGEGLINAGKALIEGLINGIKSKIGDLKNTLGGITNLIPKVKGPPEDDKTLLEPSGRMIMDGLVKGITSQVGPLRSLLSSITKAIGESMKPKYGLADAAKELLGALSKPGTTFFEDMMFSGASENFSRFNDQLGDIFYAGTPAGADYFGANANANARARAMETLAGLAGQAGQVNFGGDLDGAMATAFMALIREGKIQLTGVF